MKLSRRDDNCPTEEARAFREEAAALRLDMAEVRLVIADTMVQLVAFTDLLRDLP